MNQADSDCCLLFHTGGKLLDLFVGEITDSKICKELFLPTFNLRRRDPSKFSKEIKQIIHGKLWVQLNIAGQKSDTLSDCF